MPSIILMLSMTLARYIPMLVIDKASLSRAAFFAPREGGERIAYLIYQLSTLAIIVLSCLEKIKITSPLFYIGMAVYALGVLFLTLSAIDDSRPSSTGINTKGLYRFSRNPMYIAFFVCLMGFALLAQSVVLFALTVVFQVCSHWIILSEERWCIQKFGDEYAEYMKKTRRYL